MTQITFDEVYLKYRSQIERYLQYQYGYSLHDAEEITADVFLILFTKWEDFESHNESGVVKFIYRTAKNKSMEFMKEQKKKPITCSIEELLSVESQNADAFIYLDSEAEETKYLKYIEKIKSILTTQERLTFEYIIEKRYHYKQIAEEMNTSEINIRVRWCRIRKKIEKLISELNDDE